MHMGTAHISHLPSYIVEELLRAAVIKSFAAGQPITLPNEYPRSVPLVLSGALKVFYRPERNEELVLYFLEADQYCMMSLLAGIRRMPSNLYSIAETDCQVAFIRIEHFFAVLQRQPLLLEHLLYLYHQRIEDLLDLITTFKFSGLTDRLLALLRRKVELTNTQTLHITHEELAHELGTSRVVVSRLLKELERKGMVELHRGTITVHDPAQ